MSQNKVAKAVEKKLGKKTFDEKAAVVIKQIKQIGSDQMRGGIIKAAEDDIADAIKRGLTDDEILAPALASPNYKKMLEMVGLNFDHLRVILKDKRSK